MNDQLVQEIVKQIKKQLVTHDQVEIEASGRHVHLSRKAIDQLFGKNYQLKKVKELSQPGQYVCEERVNLIGPRGVLSNVVVLGPERSESQVEISQTDATVLGKKVPIRESGKLLETPGIIVASASKAITLEQGLIIAQSHIHMTPQDAHQLLLENGQRVSVEVQSARPLTFHNVVVRVSKDYATFMHIDYDEANACGYVKGLRGRIIIGGEQDG